MSTATLTTGAETFNGFGRTLATIADTHGRDDLVSMGRLCVEMAAGEHGDVPNRNLWAFGAEYLRAAFDVRFGTGIEAAAPAPAAPKPAGKVPAAGTYTVVLGSDDDYVTLEIADDFRKDAPAGSLMAAYLYGPDNGTDFAGFAFITPAGDVRVWGKCRGKVERQMVALAVLMGTEDAGDLREAYALRSGRCSRCRRKLTVPASLHRGLGPDCAAIIG